MTSEDRTLLRHATIEVLASRHPAALPLTGIRRRVEQAVDFAIDDDEFASALDFLVDLGQVKAEPDPLGAILYYRATASGLLAVERAR